MRSLKLCGIAVLLMPVACWAGGNTPVPLTLLHTNDLHSHFRPEKTPLGLGGVARLKTAIDRVRSTLPNTLLVDGGDWSDGDIYYTEGAGREVLRMMDLIGYDVAVVGNHDWLNGPDVLLNAISSANPKMALVAANFRTDFYKRGDEFKKRIPPYVIRTVGNAKVAFIGLATYEFIYDKFIDPIRITEPFILTRELAERLKKQVDAVVVISHNRIAYNQLLLEVAPEVDLVIGAHDHVELTQPIAVKRRDSTAWVVETGCWGKYLGRVDLQITPRNGNAPPHVDLLKYGLTQIDRTIPEDPAVTARIDELESTITRQFGSVFTDSIGDSQVELRREGDESTLGDFVTDAYREVTGADLALDVRNFVYGSIHEGPVTTVDVYNANPAVFNPGTGKNWTLKTLPIKGSTLSWIFKVLLFKGLPFTDLVFTSGVHAVYNGKAKPALPINVSPRGAVYPTPLAGLWQAFEGESESVDQILIRGKPLDNDETYHLTGGGGIFEIISMLDRVFPHVIPMDGLRDTGVEAWRATVDYVRALSPITPEKLSIGNRLVTLQPDLGILYDDVSWSPLRVLEDGKSVLARVGVVVHNFGGSVSDPQAVLMIGRNKNGNNLAIDSEFQGLAEPIAIAPLRPGESRAYSSLVVLTPDRDVFSLMAMIRGNPSEANHGNDDVLRYFTQPRVQP